MLTKSKISYIKSLHEKSGRKASGFFLVEGRKSIGEFLTSDFEIIEGLFTEEFMIGKDFSFPYEIISQKDLERISTLHSNDAGLIVVSMKREYQISTSEDLVLMLDGINDPGNLGTIIRIADWYGISSIIASHDTVDCYNPKVIMATMGSFTRVHFEYHDLEIYCKNIDPYKQIPIYGAYLNGENIRTKNFTSQGGYLVIGNESHGIRPYLETYITDRITIPRSGQAESLNAGVATAVILERMLGNV